MEEAAKARFLIRTAYFVTVGVGTVLLCRFVFAYFMPFLAGGLIAWAVQRPAAFLASKTGLKKRSAAFFLALFSFVIAAALFTYGLYKGGIALGGLLSDLSGKLPEIGKAFLRIKNGAAGLFSRLPQEVSSAVRSVTDGAVRRLSDLLSSAFSSAVTGLIRQTPLFLFHFAVALAASCYMAIDFERLTRFGREVIGRSASEKVNRIKDIFKNSVLKLIKGYFLLSLITLGLLLVGLLILHVKYAVITALLIAAVDFLPVFGAGVVLIPWGAASFFLSDVRTGAGLLILYAVIALVRYFAEPKVVGGQTGVNPLFMLAALFIGLKLLGGAGLFVAPMALIVTVEYYKQEMRRENQGKENK